MQAFLVGLALSPYILPAVEPYVAALRVPLRVISIRASFWIIDLLCPEARRAGPIRVPSADEMAEDVRVERNLSEVFDAIRKQRAAADDGTDEGAEEAADEAAADATDEAAADATDEAAADADGSSGEQPTESSQETQI